MNIDSGMKAPELLAGWESWGASVVWNSPKRRAKAIIGELFR
ncbi:MAG: hypothetical protein AAGA21_09425 [Pseudomonadota bacterium]